MTIDWNCTLIIYKSDIMSFSPKEAYIQNRSNYLQISITRVARATEYSQRSTGNYPARATEFADCAEAKTRIVKRTSGSFSVGSN